MGSLRLELILRQPLTPPSSPTESGSVVEDIDISLDEEAEERATTRDVPIKDGKPLVPQVQDEVDRDLLEAKIEEEEVVVEAEKREESDRVFVKDGKMLATSSSPSSYYSCEVGQRE